MYHHSSYWVPSRFWVVHQQISVSTIMPLAHLLPKYIHLESNLSLIGQSFEKFRETVGISVGWTSVDGSANRRKILTKAHSVTFGFEKKCQKNLYTLSETNSSQLNHWSRKISFLLKDGLLAASMLLFWGRVIIPQMMIHYEFLCLLVSTLLPRISTLLSIWSSESMAGGVWYSSTLGIQLAESVLKTGHPKIPKPTK